MQSYLKTKPIWIQLLLFVGMAFGIFMVMSLIGIAILSAITGVSLVEMADPNKWDNSKPGMITFIRGMLAMQFLGLFVIPCFLFAYFSDPKPKEYLGLRLPFNNIYWIIAIAALLLAIPLVELTGILNKQINFGEGAQKWMQSMEDEAAKTIQFMLSKNTPGELLANIIFIALFAGVGEELFFRGVLQRILIKAFKSPWAGIIAAAFLFSFFHFQFFGFVPRFLLGILLGAIYWYSGSLFTAMLAHFVYDAFFIILIYFKPQLLENTDTTMFSGSTAVTMGLLSAGLLSFLVWWMMKKSPVTYEKVYANESDKPASRNFTFDE